MTNLLLTPRLQASETSNSTGSSIQTTSTEPLSPTKVARSLKSAQSVRDSVAETSFQTTDEYEITAGLVPWKSVPVQEVDKRGGNIPSTSNPKALLPSVLPFSPTRLDKTLAHARSVRAAVHKTGFKSTEEYEKEIGWAPLQVSWKRARLIDHQKNMTLQHGSFQPQKTWKFVQEHTS